MPNPKRTIPKRIIPALLALALLFPALCARAPHAAADQAVHLVSGDWAPYSSPDPDRPGITTEIVRAAFEAAGVETTLEFYPWPRCEQMVREGRNVAAFPYVRSSTREGFAFFSKPMLLERTYLFFRKDKLPGFDFTGFPALLNFRVGTLKGFIHQEMFAEHGVPARVMRNNATAVEMLLRGRLDLFPMNDLVARRLLARHFPLKRHQLTHSDTPLYEVTLHLMVSRNNPQAGEILARFNEGLEKVRADGTLARLVDAYQ